jgi:hypothetical protein
MLPLDAKVNRSFRPDASFVTDVKAKETAPLPLVSVRAYAT